MLQMQQPKQASDGLTSLSIASSLPTFGWASKLGVAEKLEIQQPKQASDGQQQWASIVFNNKIHATKQAFTENLERNK